ncbi:MAG: hypothetical protein ROZ00_04165 [Denitratisoma sp.]|nr:hypothetical protein [Denitratisoma sp.]
MSAHIRNIRVLSIMFGFAFMAWGVWGLIAEEHSRSVVESWLIVLGFGALLVSAGATFRHDRLVGRILIGIASAVIFLYALAWLLLGGVADASGYWPGITIAIVFASYATYVSATARAG